MKIKNKTTSYILIAIIIVLIYVILGIKPLSKEYQFTPLWKIDVTNPTVSNEDSSSKTYPFKLGQTLGYYTDDGKVTNFVTFPNKASISENFYTFYNPNNSKAILYDRKGNKVSEINEFGFPMLKDDRLYVFLPGGCSFTHNSTDGKKLWEYEGTSPITAFNTSSAGCVAGFANGDIIQFDENGTIVQHFAPGGSELPVISGAAISSDGEYIATISGQNKQRFVLAKKDGAHTKIIYHQFLDSETPTQKLVEFSSDDSCVFFCAANVLGVVDTKTCKCTLIKTKGQGIMFQEAGNNFFLLTKNKKTYTVYIIEKGAALTGSFTFDADSAFIKTNGSKLFIGKNSTISCIDITQD